MNSPYVSCRAGAISRRSLLRGIGAMVALPFLECMTPVFARSAVQEAPARMLLISNNLGVLPKPFFPEGVGRDYQLALSLRPR